METPQQRRERERTKGRSWTPAASRKLANQPSKELKRADSKLGNMANAVLRTSKSLADNLWGGAEEDEKQKASKLSIHEQQLVMVRELIDVQDLESYGVEPRYARHLVHQCHQYKLAQMDFSDARKSGMTELLNALSSRMEVLTNKCTDIELEIQSQMLACRDRFDAVEGGISDAHRALLLKEQEQGVQRVIKAPRYGLSYQEEAFNAGRPVEGVGAMPRQTQAPNLDSTMGNTMGAGTLGKSMGNTLMVPR